MPLPFLPLAFASLDTESVRPPPVFEFSSSFASGILAAVFGIFLLFESLSSSAGFLSPVPPSISFVFGVTESERVLDATESLSVVSLPFSPSPRRRFIVSSKWSSSFGASLLFATGEPSLDPAPAVSEAESSFTSSFFSLSFVCDKASVSGLDFPFAVVSAVFASAPKASVSGPDFPFTVVSAVFASAPKESVSDSEFFFLPNSSCSDSPELFLCVLFEFSSSAFRSTEGAEGCGLELLSSSGAEAQLDKYPESIRRATVLPATTFFILLPPFYLSNFNRDSIYTAYNNEHRPLQDDRQGFQ